MNEVERVVQWQKTKDPNLLAEMVIKYQPTINTFVNRYRTTGVSQAALRAKANAQMLRALRTYDPRHKTAPNTHIWNNLKKVQRIAGESLQSGHVPEYRSFKRATFTTVHQNLTDRYGHEPSVADMANELKWSQREVSRMYSELGKEVPSSAITFDSYGSADPGTIKDMRIADYLYHESNNKDKVIMEHVFGYGGKKKLKNKEIAKLLNTNEMEIVRARKKLAEKIRSLR